MTTALRVAAWSLAIGALALLLIAPNANGPLLILVWAIALTIYRSVASVATGRGLRVGVGVAFLWLCFIGAFWGGWFLIPAGVAFVLHDARTQGRGVDPRLLGAEVVAAAASAVSGLIALAVLVETQPAARLAESSADVPVYENLAELATLGPPTDRLDLAVTIAGILLGLLVLAAVAHALTSSRLALLAMWLCILGLSIFAALASLSAGWWFLPAVALGILAGLVGWQRRGRQTGGAPPSGPGSMARSVT